jgi:aerobic-type carbon monoxide dehydrogenase small subunit (CoxS/CutS family)
MAQAGRPSALPKSGCGGTARIRGPPGRDKRIRQPVGELTMEEVLRFTLNGKPATVTVDTDRKLLWVLRTELGLTGTKYGCGEGHCGACTVLLDDRPVRSCVVPARAAQGRSVTTIEGLARNGDLHPLQKAFIENDALQCGFCTPGMILTAYGLLRRNPRPSEAEIVQAMENNLCRCGAHKRIVAAIQAAATEMGRGS